MSEPFLPYGRQCIEDDDVAAVAAALRGDYLTTGPAVAEFERALAARVGAREAVVCANGTAALHLAVASLDLTPGEVCIVPAITFVATANAVRYCGGEVLFADVDADTGLLTEASLDEALRRAGGRPPRAVLPVHLAGQACDLAGLARLARQHRLAVVEDAAHAIGSSYAAGNAVFPVGACAQGDMATFSFHPVKTVTMGEGGAITTNDAGRAERLRRLRSHGLERRAERFVDAALSRDDRGRPHVWSYELGEPGFNYRATDLQCALGLSQLAKLDRFIAIRRRLVARYDRNLAALAPAVRPLGRQPGGDPAWHLYVALIDFAGLGRTRDQVMADLRQQGIGSQVHYIPVHRQPYYRERYGPLSLPGAERYYARCLSLPLFAGMSEADVDRAVGALAAALGLGGR